MIFSIVPKANIIGLHNIKLSKYKFQELYNHTSRISSVGFEIESCPLVKGDDNSGRLFCIYRLFEDGSLKVQYVTLTENGPVDRKDIGDFMTKPEYTLKPFNAHFKQILSRLALDTVPHRQKKHVYTEVYNMNVSTFDNYLNKKVEAGNEELSSELKEHVASNVRQMKEPTSFRNLFEENGHHYESYEREGLKRFLEELKTFEDIDCIYLNSDLIPQLRQNSQSLNTELHKKLDDAYQKEIQMSTAVLLPRFYDDDDSKVQYFNRERVKFLSSVTSKVLASCWKVGNADYKNIPFPQLDFSAKLRAEEFPRFGDSRSHIKRRRSSEIKMPIITVEEEDPDEMASSMPIVKVETVTAPKKKRTVPTVKYETNNDVVPRSSSPPRPSSQPDHLLPPSPARAFTSISTQPAPGAYGSRKKAVTKKKKKPKVSGFK
ncbi:MAG: hypothetical protein EXX96DRAFT_242683 [Benjaminiella poitrasii]|nr:MAG: hypothetical protein EXX96DRAFT_242683 [Benjaminiella poitrasii]